MNKRDFTAQFINLWYEEESLWNVRSDTYKNKVETSKAVQRIGEKLEITGSCTFSCI